MSGPDTPIDAAELAQIREAVAYRQICDCLYRYARGIDRRDAETFQSAFWPGAQVDYSFWRGEIGAFIEMLLPAMGGTETQHFFGNILARIDGDQAAAETYFQAYHRVEMEGGLRDVFVAGRYLDMLERRAGEWRIADRILVFDWYREAPDTGDWSRGFFGITDQTGLMGRIDEKDPSRTRAAFARIMNARPESSFT